MAKTPQLISIADLSDADISAIMTAGARFAEGKPAADSNLRDAVVGIYFAKTSTRTRTAFSVAALRLGARIITYGPGDLQTSTGETVEDTGRVLSGMLDVLVARTAAETSTLRGWAEYGRMSVINAMTAEEHPTQALADLTTLLRRFGTVEGLRVLYLGDGNNTAAALALALSRFKGVTLDLRTPPGYGVDPATLARAAAFAEARQATVTQRHDLDDLPADLDVIYTTRWQTTGTTKPDPDWRSAFLPFRVESGLWWANPRALFMHDLPAHRGEEVTAEVLDGHRSIAFEQAEMKMHSAMAVLDWCAAGRA